MNVWHHGCVASWMCGIMDVWQRLTLFHNAVLAERIDLAVDGLFSGGHAAFIMVFGRGRPEIIYGASQCGKSGDRFPITVKEVFQLADIGPSDGHGAGGSGSGCRGQEIVGDIIHLDPACGGCTGIVFVSRCFKEIIGMSADLFSPRVCRPSGVK